MKRNIKINKILSIFFSVILGLTLSSCTKEERLEHTTEDFAIDTKDPRKLVGFADYYFIAEVNHQVDTEYRDPIITEGDEEIAFPYTNYKVKVLNNIKGELPLDEEIVVTKAGEYLSIENPSFMKVMTYLKKARPTYNSINSSRWESFDIWPKLFKRM